MTVSWPHAQQMFHPTGLKQKVKLKKLLESFVLPSGHVDRKKPIILSLIFNICVVEEDGSPGGTFPFTIQQK